MAATPTAAKRTFEGFTAGGYVVEPLGAFVSMTELLDHLYKRDRLNREDGTRERLIADRERKITDPNTHRILTNLVCVVSYHDSVTGHGVYARVTGSGFEAVHAYRPGQ